MNMGEIIKIKRKNMKLTVLLQTGYKPYKVGTY